MTPRVVLDTNVIVSALLYGGNPEKIFDLVFYSAIHAVSSPTLISELLEVLSKKFHFSDEKLKYTEKKVKDFFTVVRPKKTISILKDKADNRVLEAAIEGKCSYIITGDKGLLQLASFKDIKIVTAAEFLKELENS